MMKSIVKQIKHYKKSFREGSTKEKKVQAEINKEQAVVIDDPAQVLADENQQEESSEEFISITSDEVTHSLEYLHTSLKKLLASNKQISSVGKHLSTQTDSAIQMQLIAGYPYNFSHKSLYVPNNKIIKKTIFKRDYYISLYFIFEL